MHADTINLLPYTSYWGSSESYAAVNTGGLSLTAETYSPSTGVWSEIFASGGHTVGNVTTFSNTLFLMSFGSTISANNATFNTKTDIFKGTFFANQQTWYLTEKFNAPYATYPNFAVSTMKSAKISTLAAPEPSTLGLLGTGLFMIAGMARKRLVGPQSYSI
jgi:hypothetical protein